MSNIDERLQAIVAKALADGNAITIEAIRAAYDQGFEDGIDHIVQTARADRSSRTSTPVIAATPMAVRENPFNSSPRQAEAAPSPKRAPYGLCRRAITEAFRIAGDSGIYIEMVIETGFRMEGGLKLAASSVRSTLIEMQKASEIERRGARWYRVSHPERETAGHAHEADPAAPIPHNQGGPNGAALENP
jgi:hypothetical protein